MGQYMLIKSLYFFIFCSTTFACSVPVFRYALEYWQPDPYQIILNYNPLQSNNFKKIVKEINKHSNNRSFIVKKTKRSQANQGIILKYPANTKIKNNIYEDSLTVENFEKIIKSPARQKLIDKITGGDSLVFLILEGDNHNQNNRISKTILKNISILENEIKLPHELSDIPKEDLSIYDTNIIFKLSMMRLSKTNSEEKVFINVLTKSLPEKIYKKSEPIVFPIFARGRMIGAILEKDLNTETLRRLCEYIAGECSCEIKSRNPGFDTFIPVGWNLEKMKSLISEVILPPLSGFSEFMLPPKHDKTNSTKK